MLTSNVPADPSCSTTKSGLETADHVETEESGWTDCFTWEKVLYTGKDLEDLATSSQISTARAVSTLTAQSKARNYELIAAADLILAKEARQCLIADHTTSLQARQSQAGEYHQLIKAGVRSCRLANGFAAQNHPSVVGASSMVSDASSEQSSSFPFTSSQFLRTKTGLYHDAALLMNTVKIERITGGRLGNKRDVCGSFHDTAVEDTCRKMRRPTMPSNSHSSSSLSAALSSAAAPSSQPAA